MNDKNIKDLINKNITALKDGVNHMRGVINKNSRVVIIICIVVLIASLLTVFVYLSINTQSSKFSLPTRKSTPTFVSKLTPTLTPTPVPLVQGPQTFSIGMKGIPQMYEVWFNTIDPKKGTQTVKLKIRDQSGKINSAAATVKTDKLSKKYNLSLSEGTASDGVWTGSWMLNDTYNRNFIITFSTADDKGNKSSVDLTIR